MDPNPFLRNTFWTVSVGTMFSWINYIGIHPGTVQRFVALPTYKKARNALLYFAVGLTVVKLLTCSIGLLIYAKYKDCDPVKAGVSVYSNLFFTSLIIFEHFKKILFSTFLVTEISYRILSWTWPQNFPGSPAFSSPVS